MAIERDDPDRALLPQRWSEAKSGDDRAVSWLVERYHWLALKVARAKPVPPHFDREDVISWANGGLFDAVRKFKPEQNGDGKLHEHFIGFATLRIHGAILDGMKAPGQSWATREVWRQHRRVKAAEEELEQVEGRPVSRSEVAAHLGVEERTLPVFRQQIPLSAIGDGSLDAGDELPHEFFHDTDTPDDIAQVTGISDRLAWALSLLPADDQRFLADFYVRGMDDQEVAAALAVPVSTVRPRRSELLDRVLRSLSLSDPSSAQPEPRR